MKLCRLFALGLLLTAGMWAAERVSAFRAELAGPAGNVVHGTLVAVGNDLVFVNSAQPDMSFAVPRQDLQSLTLVNNGAISCQLSQPYQSPYGSVNTLSFLVPNPADRSTLAQWAGMPIAGWGPRTDESGYVNGPVPVGAMAFDARHGDDNGRLMVGPNSIDWVDVSNQSKSRHWDYSQLKGVDRDDSDQLVIKPVNGDSFKLKTSPALRDSAYNAVANHLAQAQSGQ